MEIFKDDVAKYTRDVKEKIEKNQALSEEDLKVLFLLNAIEEESHEK